MSERASREEIELYLQRVGKRGELTLSTLGKLMPFAQLLETDLGYAILSDMIVRYEELLVKVSEVTASDEEKIEFKVLKKTLMDLAARIAAYNGKTLEIKRGGKKHGSD